MKLAHGRRVAVVSLPFYTQYASCLPALLVKEVAEASGDRADVLFSHIQFALNFIRSQEDHHSYKRLTHEAHLADLALIPLLSGWQEPYMRDELEAYASSIDAPGRGFRDRLGAAMHGHLDRMARELGVYDVVAITATHYQLVPSLLLAQYLDRRYGNDRPRIVLGGYLASPAVAGDLAQAHPELDVVVYGEVEDVWPTVTERLEGGKRGVVRGRARSFRQHCVPALGAPSVAVLRGTTRKTG